jgi:DNA-binding MarR family transcriptional regulator
MSRIWLPPGDPSTGVGQDLHQPAIYLYKHLYMMTSLGFGLRVLIDQLDGAVDRTYRQAGLDFRARFFPYFRLLLEEGELAVGEFACRLGVSQPAVSQTLGLMSKAGLVERRASADRRERRFRLTAKSQEMLPLLRQIWRAVSAAAVRIDKELPTPLGETIGHALGVLADRPFGDMIEEELLRA